MEKNKLLYLIERFDKDTDYRYYAEHGEVGGVPDAIGYECPAHARKFRTEDEALRFIHTELPEWGRTLHRSAALDFADFIWDALGLATLLWLGEPIPDSMLGPTVGRLRLWRR